MCSMPLLTCYSISGEGELAFQQDEAHLLMYSNHRSYSYDTCEKVGCALVAHPFFVAAALEKQISKVKYRANTICIIIHVIDNNQLSCPFFAS
jgi:hypothetical protein